MFADGFAPPLARGWERPFPEAVAFARPPEDPMQTELTVNSVRHVLDADARTTLLDALRHHLGLTGTKKGCDHGQCGACTVLLNGRRINACLTLACMHAGDEIITIEGLSDSGALSPLQQAFVAHDGYQCGYCTPGQIISATATLHELEDGWPSHVTDDLSSPPAISPEEIAERMSGNLCRCAAYPNIVEAILEVAGAAAEPERRPLDVAGGRRAR